jgi:hypothetical protein
MPLSRPLTPALGGTTTLSGAPVSQEDVGTVRLVRRDGPAAHSIFEDTPVTTPDVWQPLQMRRVRYFKKPVTSTPPAAAAAAPTERVPR